MLGGLRLWSKLLIIGSLLTAIPLICVFGFVAYQDNRLCNIATEESRNLAYSDLDHIVKSIYALAESHQEVIEKNLTYALKVARHIVDESGGLAPSGQPVRWNAVNQFDGTVSSADLPGFSLGGAQLPVTSDAGQHVPVVDDVAELLGVTCTIFQRLSPSGDMLRVATSILKKDGLRAIGTYIPARNPDGNPNPVIKTVLAGQKFTGRAYVVNDWYITTYEPILDGDGQVAGMLYVGIPQQNVDSLRRTIMNTRIGKEGYVTVIDSDGRYVISKDGKKDGQLTLDLQDSNGKFLIKERIQMSAGLKDDQTARQTYVWQGNLKETRLVYFRPWDWIISAGADEADFLKASIGIRDISSRNAMILGIFTVLVILVSLGTWYAVSRRVTRPINQVADGFKRIADGDLTHRLEVSTRDEVGALAMSFNEFTSQLESLVRRIIASAGQLNLASDNLNRVSLTMAEGAERTAENAAGLEANAERVGQQMDEAANAAAELSAGTDAIVAAVEEMSASVADISGNAAQSASIVEDAVEMARSASLSVAELRNNAGRIGTITGVIVDIADQTKLLALNATIEAARAGAAGKGFSVVAEEVKQLAGQTAKATEGIRPVIQDIQVKVNDATTAIERILSVIGQSSEMVRGIAAAVEQQRAVTTDISRNVSLLADAAEGLSRNTNGVAAINRDMTGTVGGVRRVAGDTSAGTAQVLDAARELLGLAGDLESLVKSFRVAPVEEPEKPGSART